MLRINSSVRYVERLGRGKTMFWTTWRTTIFPAPLTTSVKCAQNQWQRRSLWKIICTEIIKRWEYLRHQQNCLLFLLQNGVSHLLWYLARALPNTQYPPPIISSNYFRNIIFWSFFPVISCFCPNPWKVSKRHFSISNRSLICHFRCGREETANSNELSVSWSLPLFSVQSGQSICPSVFGLYDTGTWWEHHLTLILDYKSLSSVRKRHHLFIFYSFFFVSWNAHFFFAWHESGLKKIRTANFLFRMLAPSFCVFCPKFNVRNFNTGVHIKIYIFTNYTKSL